jgi:hypothetical protein
MDIPMLDDAEFAVVGNLLSQGMQATKEFRLEHGLSLRKINMHERFQPALKEYERLTGFHETNANALWHHRISIYGPPCDMCGKVLRTANTSQCFECGHKSS